MQPPTRPAVRWRPGLAWAGVAAVLGLVFAAYLDPHTVRALADQVWSCF